MRRSLAVPLCFLLLLLSSLLGVSSSAGPAPGDRRATINPDEETRISAAWPRVRRISGAAEAAPRAEGEGAFQLRLDVAPETISRAFLTYELAGVPHWTAAVRSINDLPALGGFGAVASSGTALQIEEINPRWLRRGVNQIVFFPASGAVPEGLPYLVRDLRLVYVEGAPRPAAPVLRLASPLPGEDGAAGVVVRGFVDPANLPEGPAELFVDGSHVADAIGRQDGAFAVFVPPPGHGGGPWAIDVEVVYPDGTRLRQTVRLREEADPKNDDADERSAQLDAEPGESRTLALGPARLEVPAGALARPVKLSLRRLAHGELPALDDGMTNVTPLQGGFRLGPHGLRFQRPVTLRLPYDAALIPRGLTADDVRTFFFDEATGLWVPLPRAAGERPAGEAIASLTDHFTDFINATLVQPDEPAGASFTPNSLQELAQADPAAGIVQIEPPVGGPTGAAMLDFSLTVPPGRQGLEPELAVEYDSSGGNGWLGEGWDLRLPSIEISTLFGAARYDGTDRYLLDGEQITPADDAPGVFVRRSEGSFERIVRHGDGPATFWWEVTDKGGTRFLYGQTAQARLQDPANGNVFRWCLEQVIDLHGNTVAYSYVPDSGGGGGNGESWVQIYPAAIDYTGAPGLEPFYHVRFRLDDGEQRPDRTSSGRSGFKTYTRRRLDRVDVLAGDALVRRYLFDYATGDFGKSLLHSIAVTGEDDTAELYRHTFSYLHGTAGFGSWVDWGDLAASVSEKETETFSGGAHSFIGVGDELCVDHAGPQTGSGGGSSTVNNQFLDVNGDGLPDRLAGDGTVSYNGFSPDAGGGGFAGTGTFPGTTTLENTDQWFFDYGAGLHLAEEQGILGVNWSWNHANDDRAVADVNGDGFPDLIGDGTVLFNSGTAFQAGTAPFAASAGGGFDLAIPNERRDVLRHFRRSDPLRMLVLPFAGTVRLTGAVERKDRQPGRDGVTVEIHHNGGRIWRRTIAADDRSACTPAGGGTCGDGLTFTVAAGDRLYFLADSIRRTDRDALLWAPRVAYTAAVAPDQRSMGLQDVTGRQDELDASGARRFVFDARDDFRLDGFPPTGGRLLPGGYHGWYYGEWNGEVPFHEQGLRAPASRGDLPDWVAARPQPAKDGSTEPVWTAAGFDLYISADGFKPSRRGGDAAGDLAAAAGANGLVRSTISATAGVDVSAGASPIGAGVALSCGASATQLDLLDLNGDQVPDQVEGRADLSATVAGVAGCAALTDADPGVDGAVGIGDGRGGFTRRAFPGLASPVRQTADATFGLNVGLSINVPRKNGQGETTAVSAVLPSIGSSLTYSQTTTDLLDVNGDGLPDRVAMHPEAGTVQVWLNLGSRFGAAEEWTLPAWHKSPVCHDDVGLGTAFLADLTVYGSFDVLRHGSTSVANAGAAFGPFGFSTGTSLARTLVDLADVNGDGLPDHLARDEHGGFRVKLNSGDRWGDEQTWDDPAWPSLALAAPLFQCLDALRSTGDVQQNPSLGAPLCTPLLGFGMQFEFSAQSSTAYGATGSPPFEFSGGEVSLDDFDGDGLVDRVLKGSDRTVYVKPNLAAQANLLATVQRPLGSTVTLAYRRQGNHVGQAADGHRIDMPASQWVLASTVVDDGRGHTYKTEFDYFDDAFYDRSEREGYGYARVRTTLPDGSTIDRSYANQDFYSRFLPVREAVADAQGNLFRVKAFRYEERPVAAASRFPALVGEATAFYEGTTTTEANPPKSTAASYEYDDRGNVVSATDFGDVGPADNLVTSIDYLIDDATWLTRPRSLTVRDGAGNLLRARQGTFNSQGDLERLEQTLAGGRDPQDGSAYTGNRNAVWTYTYDALGNLASSIDPVSYTRTFTWDGTVQTYPAEVRDSFGYVTRTVYDLKYGALAETADENGNSIRRSYDTFGRLIQVVGPYDSDASPTLAFAYGPGAPVSWAVVHHKDVTRTSDPMIDSSVFIDSLERAIQTKEDAELDLGTGTTGRTGMRVSGRIDFDARGRVASTGQPVFDSSPADQLVDVPAKNPTATGYDVLDRVRTVTFPDGAVTRVDYGFGTLDGTPRLLTVRTDAEGRSTRFYLRVQGDTLGVEQSNTIGGVRKSLITRYAYDALSQLTAVTDPLGNATGLEYDTLGRNVTLDSPDLGRTESRYDPAGNLGARITANLAAAGRQIRYLYTFDRIDRIDYPLSPDTVFTYGAPGAPANRANRIATVTDASGVEERSYGKLGELVQTVKTATALNGATPKGPYTTSFQLDSFGRLLSVVYPDGETLTYGFDAGGFVQSAAGTFQGVRFAYLSHLGYDEFGDRARMVLGNGNETRYAYDPQSRNLLQLQTTGAGRSLQNLGYQYDLTGTLLALRNDVPVPSPSLSGGPTSQTFQYDGLAQLVAAQGTYQTAPNETSSYSLTLAYDEAGDTVAKDQLHQTGNGGSTRTETKTSYDWAYAYGSRPPHAPSRVGSRTFQYDLDGNQLGWTEDGNGTRRTLTWDEENRLASVADNGRTTRFLYGADGLRTNKAGQGGETIYVNPWFTVRNGTITSKHVFADGVRLATKVSPASNPPAETPYFYQADHLGSTHFVTDASGAVFQHLEYFPSGEIWADERTATQSIPYLFTGRELDASTGLSDFGFRFYDPRQGQWISADPILDEMLDTRRLTQPDLGPGAFFLAGRLYAYVANDPVDQIDPDGLARLPIHVQGKRFEGQVARKLAAAKRSGKILSYVREVSAIVQVNGERVVTRLDFVVTTSNQTKIILEAKSSNTAQLTANQKKAFPVIKTAGYTHRGVTVPPTKIFQVRPKTLASKAAWSRIVNQ